MKRARPELFFLSLRRPAASALGRLLAQLLIAALFFTLVPPRAEASIPTGPLSDSRPLEDLAPAVARETACLVVVVVVADPIWLTKSAFGEQIAHQGSDPQPYSFAGEPYDPNVGFSYNRARWMDPRVGRFTGMDPFGNDLGDPPTLHRYIYVSNDPVDLRDPSGLFSTQVHKTILAVALFFLDFAELRTLKQASQEVDLDQTAEGAYKHAMSSRLENPEQAKAHYERWLRDNLRIATLLENGGTRDAHLAAFKYLGFNLHAISDGSSPAHRGFQFWDPLSPEIVSEHRKLEQNPPQSAIDEAIKNVRDYYSREYQPAVRQQTKRIAVVGNVGFSGFSDIASSVIGNTALTGF